MIRVEHGDMLEVLPRLVAEGVRVHAVVTDPPYHLQSIVKRFANATPERETFAASKATKAYKSLSAGFMGKQWDGGDIAFRPETWRLCYDLLPPGGYLLAFGGTRTYHRIACAIEDAGFEIRDMLAWLYGSGFPKSLNVSKAIDRHGGESVAWFGPWFRAWRESKGITQKQVAALFPSNTGNLTGCVANWELGFNMPTPDQFNRIRDTFALPFDSIAAAEREVIGSVDGNRLAVAPGQDNDRSKRTLDITAPATDAARAWDGWGTALKPALEPLCFARKPLDGTVAANVLAFGTGALNIAACRIAASGRPFIEKKTGLPDVAGHSIYGNGLSPGSRAAGTTDAGRWPSNVCHDGSDEVVGAFPDSEVSGSAKNGGRSDAKPMSMFGPRAQGTLHNDSGSAARFFKSAPFTEDEKRFHYSSKADHGDRLGSSHPTVKPVDLMRWLVRLVTPPGGTVLDCFAGSGSTVMACLAEGFDCIAVEREAEYVADIRRRIAHVSGHDTPLFERSVTTAAGGG